jgi:hypothetical protein
MIDAPDKLAKAEEILKKEGKYLQYLMFKRRGATKRVEAILEDLFNRYGQNLDGDLAFRHNDEEKVKLK